MALPIHLPDEQQVFYDDTEAVTPEDIVNAINKPLKLMAYFTLNQYDQDAHQYKYCEIPEHYIWDNRNSMWRRRVQKPKMFGCLIEVSPRDTEKFYLRMILNHKKGATSFDDLKTIVRRRRIVRTTTDGDDTDDENGDYEDEIVVLDTLQEACQQLHLLDNVDEYTSCLDEACLQRSPYKLRNYFALICMVATTSDPRILNQIPQLWERFSRSLSEDFVTAAISNRQQQQQQHIDDDNNGDYEEEEDEQISRNMLIAVAESRALLHIGNILKRNSPFNVGINIGVDDINNIGVGVGNHRRRRDGSGDGSITANIIIYSDIYIYCGHE